MEIVSRRSEVMPSVVLLDCNGYPLETDKYEYCDRFQSSVPHSITSIVIRERRLKTCGGIEYIKPWAYCSFAYYNDGKRTCRGCQFESLRVMQGMYVFPQLIRKGETLEFDYKWCDDWSYIDNLRKHLKIEYPV